MRENGFYWVKYRGAWTIAEYFHGWFDVVAYEVPVREDDLNAIGNKIKVPAKYKEQS